MLKINSQIQFTDGEISKINSIIDDKDLINKNEKKILIDLSNKSNVSDISLAKLFSKCFNNFLIISGNIKDKKICGKINLYVNEYMKEFKCIEVRNYVQDLERIEGGIGTNYFENRLIKFVNSYRSQYLEFIDFFFKIGGLNE